MWLLEKNLEKMNIIESDSSMKVKYHQKIYLNQKLVSFYALPHYKYVHAICTNSFLYIY